MRDLTLHSCPSCLRCHATAPSNIYAASQQAPPLASTNWSIWHSREEAGRQPGVSSGGVPLSHGESGLSSEHHGRSFSSYQQAELLHFFRKPNRFLHFPDHGVCTFSRVGGEWGFKSSIPPAWILYSSRGCCYCFLDQIPHYLMLYSHKTSSFGPPWIATASML